ncbi:hypothetical protein MMC10_006011 [Thelotrema lepadinum]|nr:hypothetical protein [Thelotrema lepadinum]
MTTKPTIALVPGACHPAECLARLEVSVQDAGYEARSMTLSSAFDRPAANLSSDAAYIRNDFLLPMIRDGKDIVLVVHSYAGHPGAAAIKGLSKSECAAQGLKGSVLGIVFLCAFLPVDGMSMVDGAGGRLPEWAHVDVRLALSSLAMRSAELTFFQESKGFITIPDPIPVFYPDCDEEEAKTLAAKLGRQSLKAFQEKSGPVVFTDSVWKERRAYVKTLDDSACPTAGQDAMIQSCGVELIVKEIGTAHSPFLNKPQELARILAELADSFAVAV